MGKADDLTDEQQIQRINQEINVVNLEISKLESRKSKLVNQKKKYEKSVEAKEQTQNLKKQESLKDKYSQESFEWSQRLKDVALGVFDVSQWKYSQLQVMNSVLDRRDTFVVMPTGGGKSLCYQLTALISPGITVVISPLISLIQDQIFELEKVGINAKSLTSLNTNAETNEILKNLRLLVKSMNAPISENSAELDISNGGNMIKLLYLTPEKLAKSKRVVSVFESLYAKKIINCFVIDECHCCSEYGHDFRPDYKRLGMLKLLFPKVPIMALTATSTTAVVNSVISILGLKPPTESNGALIYTSPLWRKNLQYQVLSKSPDFKTHIENICTWILGTYPGDRGIIYCSTKKETVEISQAINEYSKNRIKTGIYHSDVGEEKMQIHEEWREGDIKVIIATTAFGMGIHQPHVRYVIHNNPSKSPEAYYQESGRAGRDGEPASCILYYRPTDASKLTTWAVSSGIKEQINKAWFMIRYCEKFDTCRKIWMETYFNSGNLINETDASEVCGNCDVCLSNTKGLPEDIKDITDEVVSVVNIVGSLGKYKDTMTMLQLIDAWAGHGHNKIPWVKQLISNGFVRIPDRSVVPHEVKEKIINYLLLESYLEEKYHATSYSVIARLQLGKLGRPLFNTVISDLRSFPKEKLVYMKIFEIRKEPIHSQPTQKPAKKIKIINIDSDSNSD